MLHSCFVFCGLNDRNDQKYCCNGEQNANNDPAAVCDFYNAECAVFKICNIFAAVKITDVEFALGSIYHNGRFLCHSPTAIYPNGVARISHSVFGSAVVTDNSTCICSINTA